MEMGMCSPAKKVVNGSAGYFQATCNLFYRHSLMSPTDSVQSLCIGEFGGTTVLATRCSFWFRVLAIAKAVGASSLSLGVSGIRRIISLVERPRIHTPALIARM